MLAENAPALRWPVSTTCEVCRRLGAARVCDDCVERHARSRPRCCRCALALPALAGDVPVLPDAAGPTCITCQRDAPPWAQAVCAVDYAHPWDRLVADLKFGARPELAGPCADLLAQALAATPHARPDLILPVPLAPARLASRGYNQAWELARRLARRLGLAAHAGLLLQPLAAAHQADLSRAERERNLRGAFMLAPRSRRGAGAAATLAGRSVAVVDDVMTTGATLRACSAVLQRAGVARVQVWAFARTP